MIKDPFITDIPAYIYQDELDEQAQVTQARIQKMQWDIVTQFGFMPTFKMHDKDIGGLFKAMPSKNKIEDLPKVKLQKLELLDYE